ncbi:MAG: hypothetical protein ACMVO3_00975 [Thalassobaculum sp.]
MARADGGDARSLVELKAVDGLYPLVGELELDRDMTLADALSVRDGIHGAVAEESLAQRLNIDVGDRLRLGDSTLELRALIAAEPDRLVNFASFGPRLMISDAAVAETGLVQVGSLVRHHYRIVLPAGTDRLAWIADLEERFPDAGWRVSSLENATPGYDNFVSRVDFVPDPGRADRASGRRGWRRHGGAQLSRWQDRDGGHAEMPRRAQRSGLPHLSAGRLHPGRRRHRDRGSRSGRWRPSWPPSSRLRCCPSPSRSPSIRLRWRLPACSGC